MSAQPPASARGNNLDRVRQHNLSVILGLVHRSGPLSRSQLTRSTGLNRSTIAALVTELADLRLVGESDADPSRQVGRPSPIVTASPEVVAFAVNPEVDAVTVGVVGLDGSVLHRERVDTAATPSAEEASRVAAAAILRLRSGFGSRVVPVGVGVAVPGLVRARDGLVRVAPHLGWSDEPIAEMIEEATGLSVVAANDANLGATAESIFGAGQGVSELVYLNGGASGIGGGVIAGGVPLAGAAGYAGELGHTLVNSLGAECHCGAFGCLETEVTRSGLLRLVGLDSSRSDELESALAASDDPVVRAEIERQLGHLGTALRNVINIFNPELVVLGGFLGSLHGVAPGVLDALVETGPFRVSREAVRVVRAGLGGSILMVGAAELAFSELLADPAGVVLARA